ncbi:MAG: hypothetical protein ACOYNI_04300 [Acidimicrobiia bacterium]
MPLATEITCVDCGETAHLLMPPTDDDVLEVGDVVTYRCSACGDRWDLVVEEDDLTPEEPTASD